MWAAAGYSPVWKASVGVRQNGGRNQHPDPGRGRDKPETMDLLICILAIYLALGIALVSGGGLYWLARRDLRRLAGEIAALRDLVGVPSAASPRAINLNRRSQILRLDRMGESPETIAEMTGLPRSEVQLALKIAKLPLERFEPRA